MFVKKNVSLMLRPILSSFFPILNEKPLLYIHTTYKKCILAPSEAVLFYLRRSQKLNQTVSEIKPNNGCPCIVLLYVIENEILISEHRNNTDTRWRPLPVRYDRTVSWKWYSNMDAMSIFICFLKYNTLRRIYTLWMS